VSAEDHNSPSFTEVLEAFFGGGPLDYAEVESSTLSAGCVPVDDLAPVEKLLPMSKIPIEDVAAWATAFSNAPFLVLSRASVPHPSDPKAIIAIIIRRLWITDIEEYELYEWTTNFCGHDAAGKKEEAGGHYSWIWGWDSEDKRVLQDGFRLYVAGPENFFTLERIAAGIA